MPQAQATPSPWWLLLFIPAALVGWAMFKHGVLAEPKPTGAQWVADKVQLPEYQINKVTSLAPRNGSLVQIHAKDRPRISAAECAAIIGEERGRAGPEGAVYVEVWVRPDPEQHGLWSSLCVEDLRRPGVQDGIARQLQGSHPLAGPAPYP